MTIELNPVSVDTKGLVRMTGFCRQRLSAIRKDPALGFPEPSVIGRSLRWLVSDVLQWLQAMKSSNAAMLNSLVSQKVPVGLKPSRTQPAVRWTLPLVKSPTPTAAEIETANHQALAARLEPGEYRHGALVKTQEGVPIMRYRVMGRALGASALPRTSVQIRRKITFTPGTPQHVQERCRAARAALPAGGKSAAPRTKEPISLPLTGIPAKEVSLADLKVHYESGQSLDILCKQYRMGKSRLSKLLRQAGAQMRSAGRQPVHT